MIELKKGQEVWVRAIYVPREPFDEKVNIVAVDKEGRVASSLDLEIEGTHLSVVAPEVCILQEGNLVKVDEWSDPDPELVD